MAEFGDHVTVTDEVLRRGSPVRKTWSGGEWHHSREPEYVRGFYGGRPVDSSWTTDRPLDELEVLASGGDPSYARADTIVDLVRWPLDHPTEGIVVGSTHRYAGKISKHPEGGNSWTAYDGLAVVSVALDPDGGPTRIADVPATDLEETS